VNATYQDYVDSMGFIINVQAVNDGPVLTVIEAPEMAIENSVTTFRVLYVDIDGSEDPVVDIVFDGTVHHMEYEVGDIHDEGGTFEIKLSSTVGEYNYYFTADDKSNQSNSNYQSNEYHIKVIDSTDLSTDTDSDGIPDLWELQNGLDPQNPSDANEDPDGDTYTNLQEYLGATDPNDIQDFPEDESDKKPESEVTIDTPMLIVLIVFIILIVIFIIIIYLKLKRPREETISYERKPTQRYSESNFQVPPMPRSEPVPPPVYRAPQDELERPGAIEWDDEQ
jgi:hypothetical protein